MVINDIQEVPRKGEEIDDIFDFAKSLDELAREEKMFFSFDLELAFFNIRTYLTHKGVMYKNIRRYKYSQLKDGKYSVSDFAIHVYAEIQQAFSNRTGGNNG